MTHVRGHRRKPYRRKDGTWVRGTKVRPHYRKGGPAKKTKRTSSVTTPARRLPALSNRPRSQQRPVHVRIALGVCGDDWQLSVLRAARRRIDTDTWDRRPKRCSRADCKRYARLANRLLGARLVTSEQLAALLLSGASSSGRRAFAPLVARCIAVSSPLPSDQALVQAARCLRALGVLCCASAGRNLARCPCLVDVASQLTDDAVANELRHMATDALWSPSPRASDAL